MAIHPTAIVDKGAELGSNVEIGPFVVIENDVTIGDGTTIAPHAVIASGTRIGKDCRIFTGAVLGTLPQDLKFGGEKTTLEIGNKTTIREYATLNRGTHHRKKTKVGDNCLLMAYSHTAHDCFIGNNVIIANSVNMAGHVTIGDYAGIGGMSPIHQFVNIGQHCFIGGGYRIAKDVPPFILAMGEPLTFGGLNSIGLKRRGFSQDALHQLKAAYKLIYRSNLRLEQAVSQIEDELPQLDEILQLVKFLKGCERGIIR